MSTYHNWNQFHIALQNLGFLQVSEHNNSYLYYTNQRNKRVVILKSNKLTREYVNLVLWQLGISYEYFVELYTHDPVKRKKEKK